MPGPDLDTLFADANPVKATDDEIADISACVGRALNLKEEIDSLEALLKEKNDRYRQLIEKDIPEAMDAAGCSTFQHRETKRKVTIKDDVKASISKDHKDDAHAWLRSNNHEEIIKNEIKIPLGKGLDNVATDIVHDIKTKYGLNAERTESVHAQTLMAFCREQLAAGVELPADLLGLYVRRIAVIK